MSRGDSGDGGFLSRWSRRKQSSRHAPVEEREDETPQAAPTVPGAGTDASAPGALSEEEIAALEGRMAALDGRLERRIEGGET